MSSSFLPPEAERERLRLRCLSLMERLADGSQDPDARDALLVDIARFQSRYVPAYHSLVSRAGVDPDACHHPEELPAVLTDVFRYARVAAHGPMHDVRTFRTSGTTSGKRGEHFVRDLSLYRAAARIAARNHVFPDGPVDRLIQLAPRADEAIDSSLSYMFELYAEWFSAAQTRYVVENGQLNIDALHTALAEAAQRNERVALVGTSFAFAEAEEGLRDEFFELRPGSRLVYTGGFKGRVTEIPEDVFRAQLIVRYGVESSHVIMEYGMTELCSQAYEAGLPRALTGKATSDERTLRFPSWVRVSVVDPETLAPTTSEEGILRIEDIANLDTAWAVQTADRARRINDEEFVLLGRLQGAVARGCSLTTEESWLRS